MNTRKFDFMGTVDANKYTAPHPLDPTQDPNATAKEINIVLEEIKQATLQSDSSKEKVSLCCIVDHYCYVLYV